MWEMIKAEFRHIRRNRLLLLSFIVICFIPFLYSIFFLKSVWDPYGSTQNLPVAVVNEDHAVKYQGQTLKVGAQLVQELRKNKQLKWEIVSKQTAKEGLTHRKYYTVVTIPKDFSKNAATVLDQSPKKMELKYETNGSLNYIGQVISEMAMTKLNQKIRAQVTQAYATTMIKLVKQVGTGFNQAASGAKQISTGMVTLNSGTNQFVAGVSTVNNGVQTLQAAVTPLASGASQLASGSTTLASGVNQYTSGVGLLAAGLTKLSANSAALVSGANQLATALIQLNAKVPSLVSGVSALASGTQKLVDNSPALVAGTAKLNAGAGELADKLISGAEKVNAVQPSKKTAKMFAAPTTVKHTNYSYVPNYGHALAPYVLSVALYVGALIFNFVYPIRRVALFGRKASAWWASKLAVGMTSITVMALAEGGIMMLLGLQVLHVPSFFWTLILFGWASMAVVMFLSMTFDNPGRFVAMVLLMLQLGGAGGTFPMQVTMKFYNVIHWYLPMTYSILGLRNGISGGLGAHYVAFCNSVLLAITIAFVILLLVSMIYLQRHHYAGKSELDNNQELLGPEADDDGMHLKDR